MRKYTDIAGQKFGRWTAIRRVDDDATNGSTCWLFRCDCGTEVTRVASKLISAAIRGAAISCGCYSKALKTRHGQRRVGATSAEYHTWSGMLYRCENPVDPNYKNYGGRGITVCERWHNFIDFFADVGRRPSARHSLDRIDVNGNYEPGNVRWATSREQHRNRRNNHRITYAGETLCVVEWAERLGVSTSVIHRRLKHGWSVERTLTTPLQLQTPGRRKNGTTPRTVTVLQLLADSQADWVGSGEVARRLSISVSQAALLLCSLVRKGRIIRIAPGKYRAASAHVVPELRRGRPPLKRPT